MDLTKDSFIKMNDGHRIPVLGFGTCAPDKVPKSQAKEATKVAIDVGYRHIDAAFIYQNEVEVGEAIREKIADGSVKREEIFYTSKLWSTCHSPELVRPALMKSLKALQLDYIDLYLIHLPISLKPGESLIPMDENGKWLYDDVDLRTTWEVECHVYLNQEKLLEFCKSKDIVIVGYSVLGSSRDENWVNQKSPVLLEDPVLLKIGQKYQKSSAQVAMRSLLQRGIVVLAKSFNPERIKQNLQVFDFHLTPEDMKAIDGLNRNLRYLDLKFDETHPQYPFGDET